MTGSKMLQYSSYFSCFYIHSYNTFRERNTKHQNSKSHNFFPWICLEFGNIEKMTDKQGASVSKKAKKISGSSFPSVYLCACKLPVHFIWR